MSVSDQRYQRFPDVDAEIATFRPLPQSEWVRRRKRVEHPETLVWMVHQITRDEGGEVAEPLLEEASIIAGRTAQRCAGEFDADTVEIIVKDVQTQILQEIAEGHEGDFLEVAFRKAVIGRTIDLIRKHDLKPLGGRRGKLVSNEPDEPAGGDFEELGPTPLIDRVVDSRPGPEAELLESEQERLKAESIETAFGVIDDPQQTEVMLMLYRFGYSQQETADALGIPLWKVKHLREKAIAAMRTALGVTK